MGISALLTVSALGPRVFNTSRNCEHTDRNVKPKNRLPGCNCVGWSARLSHYGVAPFGRRRRAGVGMLSREHRLQRNTDLSKRLVSGLKSVNPRVEQGPFPSTFSAVFEIAP